MVMGTLALIKSESLLALTSGRLSGSSLTMSAQVMPLPENERASSNVISRTVSFSYERSVPTNTLPLIPRPVSLLAISGTSPAPDRRTNTFL